MRKFFVNNENIFEDYIEIVGSDINHIRNVLRLKPGAQIQVCNSDTSENYECEIDSIMNYCVKVKILNKIKSISEGNIELHIFQGLPKADKMELIIQKGTELGVSKFIPVIFERSIVKLTGKDEEKKILRWQKIAEVAAKQSKRDIVPKIEKIISIKNICNLAQDYDKIFVAFEKEKDNNIKTELKKIEVNNEKLKIAVVIGPEGGIEKEEVEQMKNSGIIVVSLGKRILRTETVALQVASIIMYELEA